MGNVTKFIQFFFSCTLDGNILFYNMEHLYGSYKLSYFESSFFNHWNNWSCPVSFDEAFYAQHALYFITSSIMLLSVFGSSYSRRRLLKATHVYQFWRFRFVIAFRWLRMTIHAEKLTSVIYWVQHWDLTFNLKYSNTFLCKQTLSELRSRYAQKCL
jgi:hypothetical protein